MAKTQPMPARNDQPAYIAATAELAKLRGALVSVVGRKRERELLLVANQPEDERISGHVEAALHFAQTGVVRRSDSADTAREEILLLRQQEESLQQAIDQKQQALYQLESQLSADALAHYASEFADMRVRYVAKLKELDAIVSEERALIRTLNAAGYYPSLTNPVGWHVLGTLDDPQSLISARVRQFFSL